VRQRGIITDYNDDSSRINDSQEATVLGCVMLEGPGIIFERFQSV
jgi:hypothetical protein